jgi:hypothetical protein
MPAARSRPAFEPHRAGRYAGNQAMLRRLSHTTPHLQCKLQIGAVNDLLEAEADRVADNVMRMPDAAISAAKTPQIGPHAVPGGDALRRKCAQCEEEEGQLARKGSGDAAALDGGAAPPIVHAVLNSPGQSLDSGTRAFFEPRFGRDFSDVRVHRDKAAARSATAVNARAYTFGRHIVVGHDAADGPTPLLAHELAHVLQQDEGTARSETAERKVQRQPADTSPGIQRPAFPCTREGGIVLCNFTTDSISDPRYAECLQVGFRVIDACPGPPESCKPQALCATCACQGNRYCRCTGIV